MTAPPAAGRLRSREKLLTGPRQNETAPPRTHCPGLGMALLLTAWSLGLAGFLSGNKHFLHWAAGFLAATLLVASTPIVAFLVGLVIEEIHRGDRGSDMTTLSPTVQKILRRAGWFAGRSVSPLTIPSSDLELFPERGKCSASLAVCTSVNAAQGLIVRKAT